MRRILKRLWPYLRPYRKWIALDILFLMADAVFELMIPMTMAKIVDVGIQTGDIAYTVQHGLMMAGMALGALVLGISAAYFSARVGQGFGANLRQAQYEHIQDFSFRNIEHFTTASLITRLTSDVNAMQMAVMMSLRILVRAPLLLVSALVLAVLISRELSQVFLVAIPVLVAIIGMILVRVGPLFKKMQEKTDQLNLSVQENLSAIRVVKAFVQEDYEKEKFSRRNEELWKTAETAYGRVVINMPLLMLTVYSTIIAILWFGGHMVNTGTLEVGLLTTFITYVMQIMMALMMVSMMLMMLSRSVACARRIIEVLDEAPDITDDACDPELRVKDGSIRFDHACFRYEENGESWNLEDICLDIASGQTVGIIGGTGSAKTSLVQLIPRLYDTQSGAVLVGGENVRRYSMEHLRDSCAMVLQKNTLFSGTIRENLCWGKENATDEELDRACRIACADEFIGRMEKGYDTDLGQGGVNVSGGQKQRLCIARAILKAPKVLILDDSTSAVDMATDARIRRAFREELRDTTKIIIAQRIASVCDADQIVVLDDGRVSAVGTHSELLETSEIYRDVYTSQQEGGTLDG